MTDRIGCVYAAAVAVVVLGGLLVGVVKFMAWWNIAMGACS